MDIRSNDRNKKIIKYNLIGIALNLFLSVFKITVGIFANAHAVMLDGVNSFSDMISLVITLLSAHIAGKRGNRSHPLGYGRLEYISSFIVTGIVMYIGIRNVIEAVGTIVTPDEPPVYGIDVIVIMVVSLIGKLVYGIVMRRRGKALDSASMVMTGADSMGDAFISVAILAAIAVYHFTGVDIEHYLCLVIAGLIIKTGIDMLRDCMTKLIGTRVDPEVRKTLIDMAARMDEVLNVSNLILHNYGEKYYVGSIDVEVASGLTAMDIGKLSHRIKINAAKLGVNITSVGISGTDINDPEADDIRDDIIKIATKYKCIKRLQSFIIDREEAYISFDLVPDYSVKNRDESIESFKNEILKKYPDMHPDIRQAIDM